MYDAYIRTHIYTCTQTYIHKTYIHMCVHTYIHTLAYAYYAVCYANREINYTLIKRRNSWKKHLHRIAASDLPSSPSPIVHHKHNTQFVEFSATQLTCANIHKPRTAVRLASVSKYGYIYIYLNLQNLDCDGAISS